MGQAQLSAEATHPTKKYSNNNSKFNQKLTSTEVQPVMKIKNSGADKSNHQDENQKQKQKQNNRTRVKVEIGLELTPWNNL